MKKKEIKYKLLFICFLFAFVVVYLWQIFKDDV
jgi:hypothetical protein